MAKSAALKDITQAVREGFYNRNYIQDEYKVMKLQEIPDNIIPLNI